MSIPLFLVSLLLVSVLLSGIIAAVICWLDSSGISAYDEEP